MKKYSIITIMTMAILMMLTIPVYAECNPITTIAQSKSDSKSVIKNSGNLTIEKGAIKGGEGGKAIGNKIETGAVKGGSIEKGAIVIEGDKHPDKVQITGHLSSPDQLDMDTVDYHGATRLDHKHQKEILEFFLAQEGLKPYVIEKRSLFTRRTAHSSSRTVSKKEYPEQNVVYVFRNMAELKASGLKYEIVGYADTFSKGEYTLMDCTDQATIDAGMQGANGLITLKYDYIEALDSTTVGLGGSGATGAIKGGVSSVYGAAAGYANTKGTPETNPYFYGITIYIPELDV